MNVTLTRKRALHFDQSYISEELVEIYVNSIKVYNDNITANEGEAIENELIYGSVSGKKSNEDGEDAEGDICIAFGGFYKLPGLCGMAEHFFYERDSEDAVVKIPYESIKGSWYYELLKML